jgi:hypothetical protein
MTETLQIVSPLPVSDGSRVGENYIPSRRQEQGRWGYFRRNGGDRSPNLGHVHGAWRNRRLSNCSSQHGSAVTWLSKE